MDEKIIGMKPGEPIIGKVAGCKNLNVRKDPSSEADVLGTIPADSEVMIDESESTSDFYKVYTESGTEGFCMKQYIATKS